ncbi:MAG: MarR family transcriptional regulator [Paracoccaceae bacterium]|nr:MAG: MarR family transcriptional regulator [Paracoccaceae bacterium]
MTDATGMIETIHAIRDQCLCLATQRAARALARRFDRLFAPLGITNGQFSLMCALMGSWRPKLSELSQFLAMDQATMTAAAHRLERKGLLELVADEGDRRTRRPRLTDAGRAIVVRAIPLWKAEHAALQAEVTGADPRDLSRILSQIGHGAAE